MKNRIAELRKARRISQAELADPVVVTRQTGASLLLVLTGILRTSPRGQILLGWVRRFKSGLVRRRAV